MPHRRPPRLLDECYAGAHRVFFTMCAFKRKRHFADLATGERSCTQLLETAAAWEVALIAYCFMPDHLHVLVEGSPSARIPGSSPTCFDKDQDFIFAPVTGRVSGKRDITITF